MSIETDFRAALLAHTPLTALVDDGVSQTVAPSVETVPLVVYAVTLERTLALNGTLHGERANIEVQCWAASSLVARQVADAVIGAVATVPDNAVVSSDRDTYDEGLKLFGQVLTVVWMQ